MTITPESFSNTPLVWDIRFARETRNKSSGFWCAGPGTKSGISRLVSSAQLTLGYTQGWVANSSNSRIWPKVKLDRAHQEINRCGDRSASKMCGWRSLRRTPPGLKRPAGQIRGRFALRRLARLGAGALDIHMTAAQPRPRRTRAYERAAKAVYEPSWSANSARPRPERLRRAADTSWSAGSTDDTMNDRLPSIFLWAEDAREPGRRVVRTANGPLHMGPFLLREAETWDARSTWRPATA